jgi:hypothetical protein
MKGCAANSVSHVYRAFKQDNIVTLYKTLPFTVSLYIKDENMCNHVLATEDQK